MGTNNYQFKDQHLEKYQSISYAQDIMRFIKVSYVCI
jgi:hypothetical protein